jgi:hypothetical protein
MNNPAASTIETVSNSSDLLWDLLCKIEDCEINPAAAAAQLSAADSVILWEEVADMDRKHAAAVRAEETAAPRAYLDAAEAAKVSRFEGLILAAQESDAE